MNRIKEILSERGETISDLANKLGISRVVLSNKIRGSANISSYQRIADVLGVPLWQIFASPDEVSEASDFIAVAYHKGEALRCTSLDTLPDFIATLTAIAEEYKKLRL